MTAGGSSSDFQIQRHRRRARRRQAEAPPQSAFIEASLRRRSAREARRLRSERHAQPAEQVPEQRILLDRALEAEASEDEHRQRPAAYGRGRDVVVEIESGIRPFKLVAFVADGEIETAKTAFDGVTQ